MLAGGRLDAAQILEQVGHVHLADLVQIAAVDRDEPARTLQACAAAFGAVVFDHHALQVLVHAGVRRALLAVAPVVVLELSHNPVELDLLAGVLLADFALGGTLTSNCWPLVP
jgi:hypothetical protein